MFIKKMKTAVVFIIYCRPSTTEKVFEKIRAAQPPRLYLIADGPKSSEQNSVCQQTRAIVESGIDWNCQLHRVYSKENLGCARRIQSGLDFVFKYEEQAIILEDDTLPDFTFFRFCEELLERYKDSESVFHICGMNMFPELLLKEDSYCFSSINNIWGWATWARAWNNFDLQMKEWENEDKEKFLENWCVTKSFRKGMKKMFDIHCNNYDPWTWDYQWIYACWKNNGVAVLPSRNLVSNIGIGPSATHTISESPISLYPNFLQSMNFPLSHPLTTDRNLTIEKQYKKKEEIPNWRSIKNFVNNKIVRKFHLLFQTKSHY